MSYQKSGKVLDMVGQLSWKNYGNHPIHVYSVFGYLGNAYRYGRAIPAILLDVLLTAILQ